MTESWFRGRLAVLATMHRIVGCLGCGFREERAPATRQALASLAECDLCNP